MKNTLRSNLINKTQWLQKNINQTAIIDGREFDLQMFRITIFALVSLVIFYVVSVNSLVSAGYTIRKSEQALASLVSENIVLKQEISKINSVKNLNELAKGLNLVESKNVTYIKLGGQTAYKSVNALVR